jgi:hypothetical protein
MSLKMVLRMRKGRIFLTTAAMVAGGALLAGCGGSSHVKTVSLQRAAYLSSNATGYKMAMTMRTSAAGQSISMDASGSFTPATHTGSMQMNMQIPTSSGSQPFQAQVVMSKDTMYMQLPASLMSQVPGAKPWLSVNFDQLGKAANIPGIGSLMDSSSTLTNPGQYLDFLRATGGSVKDVGQETIDGIETTHYQGEIDYSKLPDAVPAADRAATEQLVSALGKYGKIPEMPVDAWVDQSNLVRRLKTTLNENVKGQPVSVVVTEDFTDYGTQPAPTVPDASQTTNLLSLIHGG